MTMASSLGRRFNPSDAFGLLIIACAGAGLYSEYRKTAQATTTTTTQVSKGKSGDAIKNQVVVKESAHEFLAKLANKGDDVAARTVQVGKQSQSASGPGLVNPMLMPPPKVDLSEDFRFDVSREGLAGALQGILDVKRSYEKSLINDARRTGRYPDDFAQQCRQLREEKDELKRMIDGLNGKKTRGWWWPF